MNHLKSLACKVALASSLVLAATAATAGPHHDRGEAKHKHHKMMMKKLDLTDAQKEQMKANKEANHASMKQVKQEMKVLKKELHQLMKNEQLDRSELSALLQKQAGLKADMMMQKHAAHKQMQAVLSEEQRVKLKEMRAKSKERYKKHHKHEKHEKHGEE